MEKGFLVKKDTGGVFTWYVVDSQSTDQYISHVQYLGWPLTRRLSVSPEKLFFQNQTNFWTKQVIGTIIKC